MTEIEVFIELVNGIDWWNYMSHECVYYNPDYDYFEGTLTMSEMVLHNDGYSEYMCSCNEEDRDVPQLETCRRIVNEKGWIRVNDPLTKLFKDEVRHYRW